jgi:hypothetical protein
VILAKEGTGCYRRGANPRPHGSIESLGCASHFAGNRSVTFLLPLLLKDSTCLLRRRLRNVWFTRTAERQPRFDTMISRMLTRKKDYQYENI